MAATVGSISIDLSTNAAKFADGFKRSAATVEQQSGRLAKSMASIERSTGLAATAFKGFVGGLVAGVGLGSLTAAIDRTREAISRFDEVASNAKTVGLRTDTFQALGFAAKQANIDVGQLQTGLEVFTKNAGLAAEGTGALYSGLLKLNPALLQNILNADNQEDRLKAVADAMANATDETQKAAIAAAVFGRSGVDLVRLFEGGAASIQHFKDVAKDLGIIVPDDLLQKAGELDDKLDVLSTKIGVDLDTALVRIAPALVSAAEALKAFIEATAAAQVEISKNLSDMDRALDGLMEQPSGGGLLDFLLGPEGGGGVTGFFRDLGATSDQSFGEVRADIAETQQYLDALKVSGSEPVIIKLQTSEANAKLDALKTKLESIMKAARADLAQQFRAAENASMAALDALSGSGPRPRVFGGTRQNSDGPIRSTVTTPTGGTINVTKFGGNEKEIVDAIEESTDQGEQDAEEQVQSTDRVTEGLGTLGNVFGNGLGDVADGLGDVQRSVDTGTDEIRRLRAEGVGFDYASLEAAIRTGIVSGIDDSLLGKQFTSTKRDAIDMVGSPFKTKDEEGNPFNSIDFFRKNFGFSYAGAFADGGSFKVGGNQTGDSNLVMLRANAGETVSVSKGAQVVINYNAAPGESESTQRQNARRFGEMIQRELARA